ncbi:MAG: hypothetical protein RLY86_3115 [Pseudomonadota bacterium]|jgi:RND family efflux transporter MFP subunit
MLRPFPQIRLRRPSSATFLTLAFMVVALIVVVALSAGAQEAAQEAGEGARPPLPVVVTSLERATGYTVTDRFVGRWEPARQTRLAFERGGLVTTVAVEEGGRVAAGAEIARLDDAPLRAQRDRLLAQRDQARADLDLAQRTLDRQRTLRGQGHAAEQRYDEARLSAAALAARLADVEAAIRSVDIDLEKSVLRAPFAGTVGARMVDEGAVVSAGTAVADLLESDRPRARIGLSPDAAAGLAPGAAVTLHHNGRPFPARIVALRPDMETATRTVTALVEPMGPIPAVFGDILDLRVDRPVASPGAWLPLTALVEGRRGLWTVFLVEGAAPAQRIKRESVEVLHVAGDRAFVRGALAEGTQIVADGAHRVVPGQAVVPVTAVAAQ